MGKASIAHVNSVKCMMLKVSLETFLWRQYKAISYQQSASVMEIVIVNRTPDHFIH